MRRTICLTAALALCACSKPAGAPAANEADANAMTTDANVAAPAALASVNETSWEWTDSKSKKPMQLSIDNTGKYIINSGKEHIDHGTAVMKDGKACYISAMDKQGEVCWTDPKLTVGESGESINDKGVKLAVKRVAYTPLTM